MFRQAVLLITLVVSNRLLSQTTPVFQPYSIKIIFEEKLVPFTNKDTSFSSYSVIRHQISENMFFYKVTNLTSKITYILDSSGFYIYTAKNQVLANAMKRKSFYFKKVPKLMDSIILGKFELTNANGCINTSNKDYFIKSYHIVSDTSSFEDGYIADISIYKSVVNNQLVKITDTYLWQGQTQYREYIIKHISKHFGNDYYDEISLTNQQLPIRKIINADSLLADSVLEKNNIRIGSVFKNFKWQTLSGQTLELKKQDSQFYILDFHYKSCYPCWKMHEKLNVIASTHNYKKVKIIGVNMIDTIEESTIQFYNQRNTLFDIVFSDREFRRDSGIISYPLLIILDKDFRVIKTFYGVSDDTEKQISNFLKEN